MNRNFGILLIGWMCFGSHALIGQSSYFPPTSGTDWETTDPADLGWCSQQIDSLYALLDSNNTKAFVLLMDGKIVLEKYFGDHTQTTPWYWASAGKSLTAFIVGLAQQEGFLSIDDTTSDYLGSGWTDCTPEQEEKITIRHQLSMTTGLDDGVADHYCTLDTCLVYKADPGTRWTYHNGPYTLLDSVIEVATGSDLNAYTTQKLKNSTGIAGAFITLDYNHVFFSTARNMARFGLLMLNQGQWDGTDILTDTDYFNSMVTPSQDLNKAYGYLWWLNGSETFMLPGIQFEFKGSITPNAPADMYAAMGKNGQFLNVVPSRNMVWVRMGDAPGDLDVPYLLNNDIWQAINSLECGSSAIPKIPINRQLKLYPNPATKEVQFEINDSPVIVQLYNTLGTMMYEQKLFSGQHTLAVKDFSDGVYVVLATFPDNSVVASKLVIQSNLRK